MPPVMMDESTAAGLLNFNEKIDINLLDKVVSCLYNGNGPQQNMAQRILTTLKEHPDAWTRVDSILEFSENQQTKYYALQILETVIKTRWKVLPREQCEGIKNYIVGLIIKISSNPEMLENEKVFLGKLNIILVQILKFEWPKNWPSFISDIVGSSKTNESLCQNNMVILKLLSEEVFDFSSGQMTQAKVKHLKDSMCSEFSGIFQLCKFVLESSQNAPLVASTLETLLKFMHWIPLGYIFETPLIETLIYKFLDVPMFRNVTLKCLTEIVGIQCADYENKFVQLCSLTTEKIKSMLPISPNLKEGYKHGLDDEQKFIQNLALFFCTCLREHDALAESRMNNYLEDALQYLLLISEVDETEIFKICLEYWNALASDLYRENPFHVATANTTSSLNTSNSENNGISARRQRYNPVLSRLRRVMISRMAKPEEVLVVENEQGEVVREFMTDTDSINLYKNMRETLVYLTHLDYADTEAIMTEKLHKQVDGTEWSYKNLNTLCWAIGSISGAMHEDDERRFLVIVIRDLLGLCEQKRGKGCKAIVASNIMYVVGQYPRFLRAHWRFLKTVVNKLFEFMHETHDGVQDMACDTFIKIAHKCRRQFVTVQVAEVMPFIEEILSQISTIICDLQPQQVHTVYEALGMMVAAQVDSSQQETLIEKMFSLPNTVWDGIINQATQNVEILKDQEVVKQLANILKTNVSACKSLAHAYVTQLGRNYLDMLNVYKVMSENINRAIATNGEMVTKQPLIRSMRVVKKETLKLINNWVHRCTNATLVAHNFIPHLLDAVLYDYQRNIPAAREPEVLSTMATVVQRLESHITTHVPAILDAVFECTLEMINKDMAEFPEHRTYFFTLLEAVNSKCFPAFLQLAQDKFKLVLDSVIWAIKHTMRQVSETGLNILYQMLQNVSKIESEKEQIFYRTFYMEVLQHMFAVVTDSSQIGNLTTVASILAYMFLIVEERRVTVSLSPNDDGSAQTNNVLFVQHSLAGILKGAFPHLQEAQIRVFVEGLFSFNQDITSLRDHLRDFLVQIREFTGEDLSDLYLEERESEIRRAQEEKRRHMASVPGMMSSTSVGFGFDSNFYDSKQATTLTEMSGLEYIP